MNRPVIPSEIIEEIGLKEPKPISKIATLIQDKKHTKQFSIKFPTGIIEELEWGAGDKIEMKIENDGLKLLRVVETD